MSSNIEREIVFDHVIEFMNSFDDKTYLSDMREYAQTNFVPIVETETESFIKFLISTTKPKKVLELGTAIGYSAISFTQNSSIESYSTIEIREDMANIANENIKKYELEDKIHVIVGDAAEIIQELDEKYDMIFIDAAKGQYKKYFDTCEKLLASNGIIICDNVLFRGMVTKDELVTKRMKTLVQRLRDFISYIKKDERFISSIVPLGDGLLLIRRKNEKD